VSVRWSQWLNTVRAGSEQKSYRYGLRSTGWNENVMDYDGGSARNAHLRAALEFRTFKKLYSYISSRFGYVRRRLCHWLLKMRIAQEMNTYLGDSSSRDNSVYVKTWLHVK